jgi:hypothetical protein
VSEYRQSGGRLVMRLGDVCAVTGGAIVLSGGVLEIHAGSAWPRNEVRVLTARGLHGRFAAIKVDQPGLCVIPTYSPTGMSIRLVREHS